MAIGQLFQKLTLQVSVDFKYNYPAPIAALRCLFNGTTVSNMDTALNIETKEFSALTRDPVARNMIRTLFLNKGAADRRIKDNSSLAPLKTVGLIGGGPYKDLLEAGCAKAGVTLVSEPIDQDVDMLIIASTDDQFSSPNDAEIKGVAKDRIIGMYIAQPTDKAKAIEIIQRDNTSTDTVAHMQALCHAMRKTPTVQMSGEKPLSQMLRAAYNKEGERLSGLGISPILIENAALAAGMPAGPILSVTKNTDTVSMSFDDIKNSLLCSQVNIAAKALQENMVDPVNADLISVLVNRFPSYTGGVVSFIDTLGISDFNALCEQLYGKGNGQQSSTKWLSEKAKESDLIYPSMA